ncbi:M56 family metallopeptidase [Bacillus cereus]|uniref:M56 family metallopeptidase n=1 Tax=Bacillus cereus TaxID=1396 RepID=UPI0014444772|nr:M56 family metallopeptidase [Bacillus cereus]MEB8944803.1 M56 family metallopeptidase [Bacillus cereus]NKX61509.1 M48 family metalloprotease [Bacillus cereus]
MFGVLSNLYLPSIFNWVIETSIMASILVGLILCLKMLLKNQLTPRWQYALWLILLVRLLLPWSPNSSFSIYSMLSQGYEYLLYPMQEHPKVQTLNEINEQKTSSFYLEGENDVKKVQTFQDTDKGTWNLSTYKVFLYVWLLGVFCLSFFIVIVNRRLYVYLQKQSVITDDRVLRIFESCKETMLIKRNISLFLTSKVSSPTLLGYIRPRILLWERHIKQLDDNQLKFIFYHELAHFKRKDVGVNWLMYSLLVLHWFNPILWYAYYVMREDQEIACDTLALTFVDQKEKLAYGHTIITLLEHYSNYNQTPSVANLSGNRYALKRRIGMIKKFNKTSYSWSILGIATIIGLSIFSLMNAKPTDSSIEKESKIETTNTTDKQTNSIQIPGETLEYKFLLYKSQRKSLEDRGLPIKQTAVEAKSTGLILVHSGFTKRTEYRAPGFYVQVAGEVDVIKKEEYPTKYGMSNFAIAEEWQ